MNSAKGKFLVAWVAGALLLGLAGELLLVLAGELLLELAVALVPVLPSSTVYL